MAKNEHDVTKETAPEPDRAIILSKITNRSFIEFLKLRKGEKLCDFGCGPGLLINDIDHLYDLPEIAGVEPELSLYQKAVENNLQNKNVRLVPAEPPATGLKENEYDVVLCRSFLERVKDPGAVVYEMLRVCAPGGKVFAQEGDISNLQFEPEILHLEILKAAYEHEMKCRKRDPHVGRRLYSLFQTAGILHLQASYAPEVHTASHPAGYRLVLQYFRELFHEVGDRLMKNHPDEVREALDEIDRRIEEPEGAIYFHWNRLEGWKK